METASPKEDSSLAALSIIVPSVARTKLADPKQTIKDADFKNRHFLEANAEEVVFDNCDFSFSVIERSYFKKAHFKSCKFIGTKILWSNFRGCKFDNCDFKYAAIERTVLEPSSALASLPQEPNLRREWLQQLRVNAESLGRTKDASDFIEHELAAEREHWRLARLRPDHYYQKYSGFEQRLRVYRESIALWFDHRIWGHGESLFRLLISTVCCLLVLSFWLWASLGTSAGAGLPPPTPASALRSTWELFVDSPAFKAQVAIEFPFWSSLVLVLRYVSIGLFVAVFFRKASWR